MPKGTPARPEVDLTISSVYRQHPKWKAPKIRNEVNRILQTSKPRTPSNYPSLSYVQKLLGAIRKREKGDDPQEKLWSMGSLENYPIPPQFLPVVVDVHQHYIPDLTIRQAKWIARLSPFFDDLDKLANAADEYAINERYFAAEDGTYDSAKLDFKNFGPTDKEIDEIMEEIEKEGK